MAHHRPLGDPLSRAEQAYPILASAQQTGAEQDECEQEGGEAEQSLEHGIRPVPWRGRAANRGGSAACDSAQSCSQDQDRRQAWMRVRCQLQRARMLKMVTLANTVPRTVPVILLTPMRLR